MPKKQPLTAQEARLQNLAAKSAVDALQRAVWYCKRADAQRTLKRVREALSSAKGAVRNTELRLRRAEPEPLSEE